MKMFEELAVFRDFLKSNCDLMLALEMQLLLLLFMIIGVLVCVVMLLLIIPTKPRNIPKDDGNSIRTRDANTMTMKPEEDELSSYTEGSKENEMVAGSETYISSTSVGVVTWDGDWHDKKGDLLNELNHGNSLINFTEDKNEKQNGAEKNDIKDTETTTAMNSVSQIKRKSRKTMSPITTVRRPYKLRSQSGLWTSGAPPSA